MSKQNNESKNETIIQLLIVALYIICVSWFMLWINIQEYGSLSAMLNDHDRTVSKVLLLLARLIR